MYGNMLIIQLSYNFKQPLKKDSIKFLRLQNERFERFLNGLSKQTAQKPRKTWAFWCVFFRQLRSKSCFKMSGLSGFWTVYLKKTAQEPRKIWAVFERFFLDKPLKTVQILRGFWAVFLDKPFKNRSNRSFWSKILSVIV